ncbi:MAG: LuxR family transcriptional regulator, partial [Chitinophagaceae bacterium]
MRNLLEIRLLSQPFSASLSPDSQLENAKLIAKMYCDLENCISVLSDIKTNRSYLFNGAVAQQFGLSITASEISTIWEDELLDRVHPEDLERKYDLEFKFFQLLNKLDARERLDYEVLTKLRIKSVEGKY